MYLGPMRENMEFTEDGIILEKPLNDLDRLILDVVEALEAFDIQYAVVSGYVAVLFGRARATEDIDLIVRPFDEDVADELAATLEDAGYWGTAMPLDDLHETVADGLPVRIAPEGHRLPNVEMKFARNEYDDASLENSHTVRLPDGSLQIGSLELQIAYKLDMGAQKDFEDAVYLFELLEGTLNRSALEGYVDKLEVNDQYEKLRNS